MSDEGGLQHTPAHALGTRDPYEADPAALVRELLMLKQALAEEDSSKHKEHKTANHTAPAKDSSKADTTRQVGAKASSVTAALQARSSAPAIHQVSDSEDDKETQQQARIPQLIMGTRGAAGAGNVVGMRAVGLVGRPVAATESNSSILNRAASPLRGPALSQSEPMSAPSTSSTQQTSNGGSVVEDMVLL